MINDDEINQMIDSMVVNGYLEIDGIDSTTGEFLYKLSPELYKLIPDLSERLQDAFLDEIYNLWVKGMVDMDTTKVNPMVSLNENAFDEEKVAQLTIEERHTLFVIMQAMKKEE